MIKISKDKELSIDINVGELTLAGNLYFPADAAGIVVFAHGSGSGRFSPRNQFVATTMNDGGFATLLFDLLTAEEEAIDIQSAQYRFNIPLLAKRLMGVTDWIGQQQSLRDLNVGYFGASTGASAALIAAAERSEIIKAVVSRGGRADLANDYLPKVKAPTLLIVGELDEIVIQLNQQAQEKMKNDNKLEIVPGATHLFEEPGTLEKVAELAKNWFKKYLK